MEKTFYARVASLTGLEATQLEKLALGELIQNIILPDICIKDPSQVSDEFVMFMAEFGHDIYKQNAYHGEALYDMALQHFLQDGGFFALPDVYRDYCLQMDRVFGLQPIGKAEITFLKNQGAYLLNRRETSNILFSHAKKIFFQILENITPEGKLLQKGLCKEGVTPLELRKLAENLANICLGFYEIYQYFALPDKWKIWPQFFLDHAKEVNWRKFSEKIDFLAVFFPGKKCRKMLQNYVHKKGSVS